MDAGVIKAFHRTAPDRRWFVPRDKMLVVRWTWGPTAGPMGPSVGSCSATATRAAANPPRGRPRGEGPPRPPAIRLPHQYTRGRAVLGGIRIRPKRGGCPGLAGPTSGTSPGIDEDLVNRRPASSAHFRPPPLARHPGDAVVNLDTSPTRASREPADVETNPRYGSSRATLRRAVVSRGDGLNGRGRALRARPRGPLEPRRRRLPPPT